ncbi:5498_t:CDS:2 [Ambispora leptoticha]|uniref:5498_t:CDS:1 n=1 Tax=Ambispora leptoticha TaxID=144679 RepID=A0A9N8W064_9GLOM|nr:5498_t:CDS:2 [Ambispora leptoticha]
MESVPLLDKIWRGEFVVLYGARASGKSTRMMQVMAQLTREGFICIYVTLELINIKSVESFWISLGLSFETSIKSFAKFFGKNNCEKKVVLFVDEYDRLYDADDDIRASFLGAIHDIKNAKDDYSLWSCVAIGPFSILHLSSNRKTLQMTITIDPAIVEDIYTRTNGHVGLVCLCGKEIHVYLIRKLDGRRRLDFLTWLDYTINSLQEAVLDYPTFRQMVHTLTKDKARQAMQLVRSAFVGFFDLVQIVNNEERNLAEFLTTEGVLIRDEETKDGFKMSSVLVDELVRRKVIPELFKSIPNSCIS